MTEIEIEKNLKAMPPSCVKLFDTYPVAHAKNGNGGLNTMWHLKCKCGNDKGILLGYPLGNLNPKYTGNAMVGPLAFFCSACGKSTEMFDTNCHGYHPEVSRLEGRTGGSSKIRGNGPRTAYKCPRCTQETFVINIEFYYWNFDIMLDFPKISGENFFNEISIFCKCVNCGEVGSATDFGKL